MDKIMDALHFAFRQKDAIYRIIDLIKGFSLKGFSFKKLISGLVIIAQLLGAAILDKPITPYGDKLDLTGYELVFCDEFEGDSLDLNVWEHRSVGARRCGFNSSSQVEVRDGTLILTGEYLEDGEFGAGWYAAMVHLKERYTRGYFEIKCKVNKGTGFWSAFWLQSPNAYSHERSMGGVGGAEIDIFESMTLDKKPGTDNAAITTTVHCNGGDDDAENIDSRLLGRYRGNDICNEYNTYGLKWTEDEYIFYVNGVESTRTSFSKGVSTTPEEVLVSLEIPDAMDNAKDFRTQMIVDSVSIYQLAG